MGRDNGLARPRQPEAFGHRFPLCRGLCYAVGHEIWAREAWGAGALRVRLGGPAPYHGVMEERPRLGEGEPASAASIQAALMLVSRGLVLWLLAALLWALASQGGTHA